MGQNPAEWAGHVPVRANETVVEHVPLHVLAQSTRVGRPHATRHFVLVYEARRAGHCLRNAVYAVHETVARGWILVLEVAVCAGASFARLWLLCEQLDFILISC